jgi:hypothetical protein
MEEEYADDDEYEEAAAGATAVSSQLFVELTPRERALLAKMGDWAEKASAQRDCKTNALIAWLQNVVKPDGKWNDERVIIFTEYRATQNWLHEKLVAAGLASEERLMTLYGGMDSDRREQIKAPFQARPDQSQVRILLATDAASEGIDLQNHCHRLVHFEIPWNPNRMEQRNGRIDRHGQKHDPLIYHFAGQGYARRLDDPQAVAASDLEADLEFLMQAVRKVEQIREDLGKVGPVIAAQVEEAMLGRRARLDTAMAEQEAGAARKQLKFERELEKMIAGHYEQLRETRQTLRLSPQNVQRAVTVALELAGQPPLRPAELAGLWPDPGRAACPVFHLPPLSGSWAACAEGLAHPHTGEIRPIVFDHQLARGRDDVVLAHLNHRLVQMALRLLRAEVWSPEGAKGLYRVTARCVPDHALDTPAVIAHARLVVIGGDSHRLHEEIIAAGGLIRHGRFQRLNVGETAQALQAALDAPVSPTVERQLMSVWPAVRPSLERALESRAENLTGRMERLLREREEKETQDIAAILTELARAIENELAAPSYRQLELFSDNERSQLARNTQALQARLAQIPAEIAAEQEVIRGRYADPQPRLFPVAVTFLVPVRLAGRP